MNIFANIGKRTDNLLPWRLRGRIHTFRLDIRTVDRVTNCICV